MILQKIKHHDLAYLRLSETGGWQKGMKPVWLPGEMTMDDMFSETAYPTGVFVRALVRHLSRL